MRFNKSDLIILKHSIEIVLLLLVVHNVLHTLSDRHSVKPSQNFSFCF